METVRIACLCCSATYCTDEVNFMTCVDVEQMESSYHETGSAYMRVHVSSWIGTTQRWSKDVDRLNDGT